MKLVRIGLSFLFLTFCITSVWSQKARFYYDEDEVRALRYAAWEAGTLFSTAATPYTRADIDIMLDRVAQSAETLSTQAQAALAAMHASFRQERYSLGMGLELGASALASLAWYPRAVFSGDPASSYGWNERPPLLEIPLSLSALGLFELSGSLELREDHNAINFDVSPANLSTLIEDPDYIDYTFPFRALAGFEYGPASASLGRDVLRWGPGVSGTLLVSDEPDFYDFLQYGLTSPVFGYKFLWIGLDYSLDNSTEGFEDPLGPLDVVAWQKNLFVHRYELLFFDRLALGIVEALMVGGVAPDIAYLNPLLILHNRYAWNSDITDLTTASSALGFELRLNPWRYMELYGSFVMNQFQTAYELSAYPSSDAIPNAYGWLGGIDAAIPLRKGWLRAGAEYVYTNPWLYVRENKFNSYFWKRPLTSNVSVDGKTQWASASLGYPYGPDARVLYLHAGWDIPGFIRSELSYEYAERGEQTLFSEYDVGEDAATRKTPSGTAERSSIISAGIEWRVKDGLSVQGGLRWGLVANAQHVEGSSSAYLDFSLGLTLEYPKVAR
jgi:hypothetical protein